jgi:hypothetical protein
VKAEGLMNLPLSLPLLLFCAKVYVYDNEILAAVDAS